MTKALGIALAGATVNHSGSNAASAYPFMVANGFKFNLSAFSLLIKINAAAPSFNVEALAAVTEPSLLKTGLKVGIFSIFTFLYSSSSVTKIGSPFR